MDLETNLQISDRVVSVYWRSALFSTLFYKRKCVPILCLVGFKNGDVMFFRKKISFNFDLMD